MYALFFGLCHRDLTLFLSKLLTCHFFCVRHFPAFVLFSFDYSEWPSNGVVLFLGVFSFLDIRSNLSFLAFIMYIFNKVVSLKYEETQDSNDNSF